MKPVSEEKLVLLSHKDCVRFALFCAEQVKEDWENIPECVRAIETTERWLEGKASAEECRNTAYAATNAAAHYATATATNAADAAAYATYAAAYAAYDGKSHLIKAQRNYYLELLHFDDIAEKLLLGATI